MSCASAGNRTRRQQRRSDRRKVRFDDTAPREEKFKRKKPSNTRAKSAASTQRSSLQIAKDRLIAAMRIGRFKTGVWAENPKEAVASLKPEVNNSDRKLGRGKDFYKVLLDAFNWLLAAGDVMRTTTHDGYGKYVIARQA